MAADDAVRGADVVILAVPDTVVGSVATMLMPKLTAGTIVVILDAAAPHAGASAGSRGHHLLHYASLPSANLQR